MAWINRAYIATTILEDVKVAFRKAKPQSVQLHEFLADDALYKLRAAINRLSFKKTYIPDLHNYDEARFVPKELKRVLTEINALVQFLTGKKLKRKTLTIRRFGKGQYTVLHDAHTERPGVDVIIDLTPEWNRTADGQIVYTERGKDAVTILPALNTISVVNRTKNMMRFVKYVNHHAPAKRTLICATYR